MGKIVKYCDTCEESFAEKFGFCPICGETLNAFEMNPVDEAVSAGDAALSASGPKETNIIPAEKGVGDDLPAAQPASVSEMGSTANNQLAMPSEESAPELELVDEPESTDDIKTVAAAASFSGPGDLYAKDEDDDFRNYSYDPYSAYYGQDKDFHITVLTERNVKQRNVLLLGTMILMVSICIGVVIASIFNHPLLVGAIGEDELGAFVPIVEEVPMTVEEEKQKNNDKDAGGGGGGGREEETPTSKGRLATQTENPLISPTKTIIQRDFELQSPIASTQGTKVAPQTEDPYGDPNSKYGILSDGRGVGGGQGSGEGTGQGSGRGTGQGSGTGSGSGGGLGDGYGDGTGSGTRGGGDPSSRNPTPTGPTKKVTFISKPQPRYTDPARINNIQGTVTLRITFLSNGQIGGISPVKGLPHGLTEQAIAAARQIRFEPALKNGQPQSVTMSVQYTFTIY